MFKNYFKVAYGNLVQGKVYSFINISGLSIGMAVALLIGLWVYYQASYGRFLPGYKNLYQVRYKTAYNGEIGTQNSVAYPLAKVLKSDIPGVRYVVQTDWMGAHGLAVGEKKIYSSGGMVGADFLKMFQFPLLKGSRDHALKDLYSIVLTQATAKALFGDEDPINKTVRLDNQHDLKVTGLLHDVPQNSTLQFNYLIPFDYFIATQNWALIGATTPFKHLSHCSPMCIMNE